MNRFREPIEVGLGWFPVARFSRSHVDLRGNLGKALGAVQVEIGSLGKVLTELRTPSAWNAMHQHQPHTPLFASTSRAKSSQVAGLSSRVEYTSIPSDIP